MAQITWSVSGGLSIVSGQGTNSVTISGLTSGVGTISADVDYYNACSYFPLTRSVTVPSGSIAVSGDICQGYVMLSAGSGSNYSWNTGATTQSIYAGAGAYSVSYSSGGCVRTANIEIDECPPPECPDPYNPNCPCSGPSCARIRSDQPDEEVFETTGIFPNPSDKEVIVQIDQPAKSKLSVQIISQFGSLVRSSIIEKGYNLVKFNIEDLTEGLYVVTLKSDKITYNRQKIVVLHKK
jgi:hypothetical protein